MKTQHAMRLREACGRLLRSYPSSLDAAFVFHVGTGAIQPHENLLFNETGLVDRGTTVEGITNHTDTIFDVINPQITLTTPTGGQARVEAHNGAYSSIMLAPQDGGTFFRQLEFNVNVLDKQSGTFSLTVLDQDGVSHQDDFDPNTLTQGSNFFRVDAHDGWLIQKAALTANAPIIQDVRQIRIDGVVSEPSASVLNLLGIGLRGWRRR